MLNVCSGIVTYNPKINRLKANIKSVSKQTKKVWVIDNNSSNILEIAKLIDDFSNVVLIQNTHNYGIAHALNQMCELAEKDAYDWILTLDQDTIIPSEMLCIFAPYTNDSFNGIICPAVCYDGWDEMPMSFKRETQYVYACMTSASLTRIEAWKIVGGFKTDYFIDYVDNEFCMKLGLQGYGVLRVNKTCINHQLGESGIKKCLFLKLKYTKHSPIRLYYMARNNLAFIKEYKGHLPIVKEYLKLFYVLLQGVCFSDDKTESFKNIKMGLRDAKNGNLGELQREILQEKEKV